ncbi:MAG: D-aminoacyl-tRNA deacylase [bacterium]|nr:D-aminoacyl-tRNA deacylase [bacterium]
MAQIASKGFPVQHGIFGALMNVSLVNHGPFTILLDSGQLFGT